MAAFNIAFEELEELEPLAEGNYGSLFKARLHGEWVAVKQLLHVADRAMHKYIERELQLLSELRHPHIVQYRGMCQHQQQLFIVTELISHGNLHDRLQDSSAKLPWRRRIKIALDTCKAIEHLHAQGVVHRDIKTQNLLVDDKWRIKLCDFGFARNVAAREQHMTLCGTDEWMAPEIFLGEPYDERVDVFSFGLILHALITRADPPERFPGAAFAFDERNFMADLPLGCPLALAECCAACCKFYPEERMQLKAVRKRLRELVRELRTSEQGLSYMRLDQVEEDLADIRLEELPRVRGKTRSETDVMQPTKHKRRKASADCGDKSRRRAERKASLEERLDDRKEKKARSKEKAKERKLSSSASAILKVSPVAVQAGKRRKTRETDR